MILPQFHPACAIRRAELHRRSASDFPLRLNGLLPETSAENSPDDLA